MKFDSSRATFIASMGQIAGIWIASDIGYYFLLPALSLPTSYNNGSVAITLYYVFWVGIAVITFWPLYATWADYGRWDTFQSHLTSYIIWSISFAGCLLFAAYVLPQLPTIHWKESWEPPEIMSATEWYFLPKSIDILFQQLLIVALVLVLAGQGFSLRKISLYCAVAFGSIHILLAFGGVPAAYVLRFMISATAFGFLFPYLILRVPNGLAFSYVLHWLYYAISVVLPHIFLSAPR